MSSSLFLLQIETMSLPMADEIKQKIKQLVDGEGLMSPQDVGIHLRQYVVNDLFRGKTPPSSFDRRYFPTHKDVYNFMYRFVYKHHN